MLKYLRYGFYLLTLLAAVLLSNTLLFTYERYPERKVERQPQLDESQAVARLSGALRIPTVSTTQLSEPEQARFIQLHRYLETSFPATHNTLTKETISGLSLLYRWQGSNVDLAPVLLLAHLDVVPVSEQSLSRWTHPPYSGAVVDGEIWGRGALDIKSGVIGILEAVETLLQEGFKPQRSIYLAFGHDEEIGGQQGAAQIAAVLRERRLKFAYILDEGGSIVSNGMIPGVESPVALIGIAEKGYLSLRLSVAGRGGHSSTPPRHTTIGRLAAAIERLENHPFPADMSFSRATFAKVGPKMPFLQKMAFANLWLTEPVVSYLLSASPPTNATIRTTTAVTRISGGVKDNLLPDKATAVVNFRIMPGETVDTATQRVREVINDPSIEIAQLGAANNPSTVSDPKGPYFSLLAQTIQQVETDTELVVAPYLVTGGTDAKHYQGLSDAIYRFTYNRYTPETLHLMHGIDERTGVRDYLENVRFIYQLLRNSDQYPY